MPPTESAHPNDDRSSQVIATYACGHGARVAAAELAAVRQQIADGLNCPYCQLDDEKLGSNAKR